MSYLRNCRALVLSRVVPDTGFLLCSRLISLVQKIQISSGGRKEWKKKKKLQVFYAKACIWDKSRADTMDSAVWTDARARRAAESWSRALKAELGHFQLLNRWEGACERAVNVNKCFLLFFFFSFLFVKTRLVHLNCESRRNISHFRV